MNPFPLGELQTTDPEKAAWIISRIVDHTNLKPQATRSNIEKTCHEANKYNFYSVCVNSCWLDLCKNLLKSNVKLCTVCGFPLGADSTSVKAYQAKDACDHSANEVDMVINVGALKSGETKLVHDDIKAVVDAAKNAIVKVIIETPLLTDDEKIRACELAKKAGAHFIKTCTGFTERGVTVADVSLIKSVVGDGMGIKASGGIRDLSTCIELVRAGATRLGMSHTIQVLGLK